MVVRLGDVVNHTVDSVLTVGINIRQEPVVLDVGLDSPGETELSVGLDEVDQLGLRVRDGASGTLEHIGLLLLGRLGRDRVHGDGKLQLVGSTLQRGSRVREVTLVQRIALGDLAGVERVSIRKDLSVFSDLQMD